MKKINKTDKMFLMFCKIVFRAPAAICCIVAFFLISIDVKGGLILTGYVAVYVVPWTLLGIWAVKEIEKSIKFNSR